MNSKSSLQKILSKLISALIVVIIAGPLINCSNQPGENMEQSNTDETEKNIQAELILDERIYPELPNFLKISEEIYSGGEPVNTESYIKLSQLGIKTIVSVDGAQPDVETARKYGLRYVHIPFGYDGIDTNAGLALTRLVREAEGPFYIHCHHGLHRGPAAAAVACIASGVVDNKGAIEILEKAGTSKDYIGLWQDVKNFQIPVENIPLPELVEIAEVSSFEASMAKMDRNFDNLKFCRKNNWTTPAIHPDLVPVQEALLVKEGLREAGRMEAPVTDKQFKTWLLEAEQIAQNVENLLQNNNVKEAEQEFLNLKQACKTCHKKYRN